MCPVFCTYQLTGVLGTLEPTSEVTPRCAADASGTYECTLCAGLTATYSHQPGLCAWEAGGLRITWTTGEMSDTISFADYEDPARVICNDDGTVVSFEHKEAGGSGLGWGYSHVSVIQCTNP